MPRFFVPSDDILDDVITIKGDDAHHIARSLRMAEGDEITVCDMHGYEHTCRLTRIRDEECECQILSSKKGETEPPVRITLYMAYQRASFPGWAQESLEHVRSGYIGAVERLLAHI